MVDISDNFFKHYTELRNEKYLRCDKSLNGFCSLFLLDNKYLLNIIDIYLNTYDIYISNDVIYRIVTKKFKIELIVNYFRKRNKCFTTDRFIILYVLEAMFVDKVFKQGLVLHI